MKIFTACLEDTLLTHVSESSQAHHPISPDPSNDPTEPRVMRLRVSIPVNNAEFSRCLPLFIGLIGKDRWERRVSRLNADAISSPFLWKIVSDYHWLEVCLSYQSGSLERTGSVLSEEYGDLDIASLIFATSVVWINERLTESSKKDLAGRLRDCLKAHAGFSSLYLEIDVATRLMDHGYEIEFPDIQGTGNYDISFEKEGILGEIECKSLSVDAGRQVHRRDFYRLMESVRKHAAADQYPDRYVILVTLDGRLSSDNVESGYLTGAIAELIRGTAGSSIRCGEATVEHLHFKEHLPDAPDDDAEKFFLYCRNVFGEQAHIAGELEDTKARLIVVKSLRGDDTSKPWLDAMRKASKQLTGRKPGIIVTQFQDVETGDLLSFSLRRRAVILANAVFQHYQQDHINAVIIQGYRNIKVSEHGVGTFSFSIINPEPKFALPPGKPEPFLLNAPVEKYLEAMGQNDPGYDLTGLTPEQIFEGKS